MLYRVCMSFVLLLGGFLVLPTLSGEGALAKPSKRRGQFKRAKVNKRAQRPSRARATRGRKKSKDNLPQCSDRRLKSLANTYLNQGKIKNTRKLKMLSKKGIPVETPFSGSVSGKKALWTKPYTLRGEGLQVLASVAKNKKLTMRFCEFGLGKLKFLSKSKRKVYRINGGVQARLGGKRTDWRGRLAGPAGFKQEKRALLILIDGPEKPQTFTVEVVSQSVLAKRDAKARADKKAAQLEAMRKAAARLAAQRKAEQERQRAEAERRRMQAIKALSQRVLDKAKELDRLYYDNFDWVGSGASKTVKGHTSDNKKTVMLQSDSISRNGRSTYCTSFVFQAVAAILEADGRFKTLTPKDAKNFQRIFFGNVGSLSPFKRDGKTYTETQLLESQSQSAMTIFGLGEAVSWNSALPGDLVFSNYGGGSGHQYLFEGYAADEKGTKFGFYAYGAHNWDTKIDSVLYCFEPSPLSEDDHASLCGNANHIRHDELVISRIKLNANR